MEFQTTTVGSVFLRFLLGWILAGIALVVISCIKYKDFIITAFTNNAWAWVNALMPIVIMVIALGYIIKSAFR